MNEIQHKKGKIFYSMGEVSEMFDVNPSLIRFWEQKFDILKPHKNKKGNRMFTPEDVDNLKRIYHLVKQKGMTLAGAQKRLKDNKDGGKRDLEVLERLLSIKSMLMEIRQELKDDGSGIEIEPEYEADHVVTTIVEPEQKLELLHDDPTFDEITDELDAILAQEFDQEFEQDGEHESIPEVDRGVARDSQQAASKDIDSQDVETLDEPKPRIVEQTLF